MLFRQKELRVGTGLTLTLLVGMGRNYYIIPKQKGIDFGIFSIRYPQSNGRSPHYACCNNIILITQLSQRASFLTALSLKDWHTLLWVENGYQLQENVQHLHLDNKTLRCPLRSFSDCRGHLIHHQSHLREPWAEGHLWCGQASIDLDLDIWQIIQQDHFMLRLRAFIHLIRETNRKRRESVRLLLWCWTSLEGWPSSTYYRV